MNRAGVEWVDELFAENERICAVMDVVGRGADGREALAIVAVGATMVGKVRVNFDEVSTNEACASPLDRCYDAEELLLSRGQLLPDRPRAIA